MKMAKRILSLVLVLVMFASLSVTAFADTPATPYVQVTVENSRSGATDSWTVAATTGKSVEFALEAQKGTFYPDWDPVADTVFEVLNKVCEAADIQIEYSWTPMYNSYYIEGINHLYEFDVGPESGWMYKVDEWFPNYGCSAYKLKDGQDIVWCYTCNGYGADVGEVWMG